MNTSYFNTTNVKGEQLKKYKTGAETEDKIVETIFREAKRPLTSTDVFQIFLETKITPFHEGCEESHLHILYNIRRSMSSNLHLIRTDVRKKGLFGRPNNYYYDPRTCEPKELEKIYKLELF